MRPSPLPFVPALVLAGLLVAPLATAGEGPPGITWADDLVKAFELAKEQDKPVMICINAKRVDWGRREPAARELRERTYRAEKVVELSEKFVCAFLSDNGTSKDFGELRARYEIDGDIVSPQHLFAYPDGRLIFRKEFWPHGKGQESIDALLKLMNNALEQDEARRGAPAETPGDKPDSHAENDAHIPPAPEDPAEREAWILAQMEKIDRADETVRNNALRALVDADEEGDIVRRLLEKIEAYKKQPFVQAEIIRALGRPGLEVAAKPLAKYLTSKDEGVRANTAVTLEYIGSKESVSDLSRRAPKEKVEMIANHMFRALGRCGAGDAKVRKLLVKNIQGAKSEVASFGPIIGLAYFEKDEKAAKDVQKLLKRWGVPGGRSAWRSTLRRSLLTWCLTEVGFGNEKAAAFLREDLIPMVGESRWSQMLIGFYENAARVCDGDESAKEEIDQGVRYSINRFNRQGDNPLMDDARRNRDVIEFEPKGEWGAGRSS